MNIFLANVGNRDVALDMGGLFFTFSKGGDGKLLAKELKCGEGTRNLALYVKSNFTFDQQRTSLRFPILSPALREAVRQVGRIDLVLLFATNQPSTTAEYHRIWDTIESARLIESLLPTTFSSQIAHLEIVEVEFNPSEHDQAYEFIGKKLDEKVPRDVSRVFASIKGGIPAMNAALRERVVQRFGRHTFLIETDEPPESEPWQGQEGKARIVSSWPFRRDGVLRLLDHMLNRHDYSGALRLLKLEGVQAPEAEAFLQHALARINLNFKGAATYLDGMVGTPLQWKNLAADAWGLQRIADVASTAQNALEREDYASFLSRATTFCENCRRLLCWMLTSIKIEKGRLSFLEIERIDRALANHLRSQNLRCSNQDPFFPTWRTVGEFSSAVIEWGVNVKHPNQKLLADKVLQDLEKLRVLEQLRNELEHHMQGVSYSDIEIEFSNARQIFLPLTEEILKDIASVQRRTKGTNPLPIRRVFKDINDAVLTTVRAWTP
jgi:hypothetical protein